MHIRDFEFYRELIYRQSGHALTPDMCFLLDSRLTPLLRKWDFRNMDALTIALRAFPDMRLVDDVVESMAMGETSFFRDQTPFEILEQSILPLVFSRRSQKKKLRIWSAGCATGQEPLSVAMLAQEATSRLRGWKVEIVATDISRDALERAQTARYNQAEIQQGLPVSFLTRYFKPAGKLWEADAQLRRMMQFGRVNLLDDFSRLGNFDIILCRNLLDQFDDGVRRDIVHGMVGRLAADGFLMMNGVLPGSVDEIRPVGALNDVYAHSPMADALARGLAPVK